MGGGGVAAADRLVVVVVVVVVVARRVEREGGVRQAWMWRGMEVERRGPVVTHGTGPTTRRRRHVPS